MKFRTEIELQKSNIEINHQTKILMLGSCFTNGIGQKLADNKFNININPTGTLYNPASILNTLERIRSQSLFSENNLFAHNGLYHSFSHHSDFSGLEKTATLQQMNSKLEEAQLFYKEVDILFVTFGTAYAFEYKETSKIVSNCHKLPANSFDRKLLSAEDIATNWSTILSKLKGTNPNAQIIFTVSPIRHLSDGLHNNQVSKASLIYAIHMLQERFENAHYFPAYEIVLDDLRDYRFYERDMCHPNQLAIDYIWDKFKEAYLAHEAECVIAEWEKIKQAINHRPFNETSDEHIHFLKQTLLKLNNFGAKYPSICLDWEIGRLENKINK